MRRETEYLAETGRTTRSESTIGTQVLTRTGIGTGLALIIGGLAFAFAPSSVQFPDQWAWLNEWGRYGILAATVGIITALSAILTVLSIIAAQVGQWMAGIDR